MRNQVNSGFRVVRGAERLAVVKKGTFEPLAIPGGPAQGVFPAKGGLLPALGARTVTTLMGQRRKVGHQLTQEPTQPDRFALSFNAYPVHAIVPVAAAHQRQSVAADPKAAVNGTGRMFKHRGPLGADGGRVIGIFSTARNGRAFKKRDLLVQQRGVARGSQVKHTGVGQPQQVIRKMGAHPIAQGCVPPVLHIALNKLVCSADHNLLTQHLRRGPGHGHGILQLIAKAGGATGLVKAGLGPQSARHSLVQQPAIDHSVKQRVRCFDDACTQ